MADLEAVHQHVKHQNGRQLRTSVLNAISRLITGGLVPVDEALSVIVDADVTAASRARVVDQDFIGRALASYPDLLAALVERVIVEVFRRLDGHLPVLDVPVSGALVLLATVASDASGRGWLPSPPPPAWSILSSGECNDFIKVGASKT